MSISSVGNGFLPQVYASAQSSATQSKAAPSGSSGQTAGASTDDSVTLSADAQAFASLNAAGVTVAMVPYTASLTFSKQGLALPGGSNGALSQGSFESLLTSHGASAQEAAQIFTTADTNDNGSISNSELLSAMSSTATSSSKTSQDLLQLMDANHDGSVSSSEYLNFETSMVEAETPAA